MMASRAGAQPQLTFAAPAEASPLLFASAPLPPFSAAPPPHASASLLPFAGALALPLHAAFAPPPPSYKVQSKENQLCTVILFLNHLIFTSQ